MPHNRGHGDQTRRNHQRGKDSRQDKNDCSTRRKSPPTRRRNSSRQRLPSPLRGRKNNSPERRRNISPRDKLTQPRTGNSHPKQRYDSPSKGRNSTRPRSPAQERGRVSSGATRPLSATSKNSSPGPNNLLWRRVDSPTASREIRHRSPRQISSHRDSNHATSSLGRIHRSPQHRTQPSPPRRSDRSFHQIKNNSSHHRVNHSQQRNSTHHKKDRSSPLRNNRSPPCRNGRSPPHRNDRSPPRRNERSPPRRNDRSPPHRINRSPPHRNDLSPHYRNNLFPNHKINYPFPQNRTNHSTHLRNDRSPFQKNSRSPQRGNDRSSQNKNDRSIHHKSKNAHSTTTSLSPRHRVLRTTSSDNHHYTRSPSPRSRGRQSKLDRCSRSPGRSAGYDRVTSSPSPAQSRGRRSRLDRCSRSPDRSAGYDRLTRSPSPAQSRGRQSRLNRCSRSPGRPVGYDRVTSSPLDCRYSQYHEYSSYVRDRDVNHQSYQETNNISAGCNNFSSGGFDKPEYLNTDQFETGQHYRLQYEENNRDKDCISFHGNPENQSCQDDNTLKEERLLKRFEQQRLSNKNEEFNNVHSSKNNNVDNLLISKSKERNLSPRRATESCSAGGSWLRNVEPDQHKDSLQQEDHKKDLRNKVGSILGRGGYDPVEYAISRNACGDDDEESNKAVAESEENLNNRDVDTNKGEDSFMEIEEEKQKVSKQLTQIRDNKTALLEDLDIGDNTADDPKSSVTAANDDREEFYTNLRSIVYKAKKQLREEKKNHLEESINDHNIENESENIITKDGTVYNIEDRTNDCEEVRRIFYKSSDDEDINHSSQITSQKRQIIEEECLPRKDESRKKMKTKSRSPEPKYCSSLTSPTHKTQKPHKDDKKCEERQSSREDTKKDASEETKKSASEETTKPASEDSGHVKYVPEIEHSSHKMSRKDSELRRRSSDGKRIKNKKSSSRTGEDHSKRKKRKSGEKESPRANFLKKLDRSRNKSRKRKVSKLSQKDVLLGSINAYLLDDFDVDENEVDSINEDPEPVAVSSENGQLLSVLINYDSPDSDIPENVKDDNNTNSTSTQAEDITVKEMNEVTNDRFLDELTSISNESIKTKVIDMNENNDKVCANTNHEYLDQLRDDDNDVTPIEVSSNITRVEVTNTLDDDNHDQDSRDDPIESDCVEMLASETSQEIKEVEEESQVLDPHVKLAQFLEKDNLLNVLSATKDNCDKNFSEETSQVQNLCINDDLDHQIEVDLETNINELSKVVPSNSFDITESDKNIHCDIYVENIDKEPVRSGALEPAIKDTVLHEPRVGTPPPILEPTFRDEPALQEGPDFKVHAPVISGGEPISGVILGVDKPVSSYAPEVKEPDPVVHDPLMTTAPVVQKVIVNNSRLRPIFLYLSKIDPKNLSIFSLDYCTNEQKSFEDKDGNDNLYNFTQHYSHKYKDEGCELILIYTTLKDLRIIKEVLKSRDSIVTSMFHQVFRVYMDLGTLHFKQACPNWLGISYHVDYFFKGFNVDVTKPLNAMKILFDDVMKDFIVEENGLPHIIEHPQLRDLLQHVRPDPTDNLVIIHATTTNIVVNDKFDVIPSLATLSIKMKETSLFIPLDLRNPAGYLISGESEMLGYKYQFSSCHGVPSSPHMCWTNEKRCESEKNGLDQLIVLLQKHEKNIVLFPFHDKSIGVLLDALSRHSLLDEFEKLTRGVGILETFFLEKSIIRSTTNPIQQLKKYYHKYFLQDNSWTKEKISNRIYEVFIKVCKTESIYEESIDKMYMPLHSPQVDELLKETGLKDMHSGYHKISLIQDFSIKPKETKLVQVYIQHLFCSGRHNYYLFFYGMLKGPVHQVEVYDQSNIKVEICNTSNKKVDFSQGDQLGIACAINKFDLVRVPACNLFQRANIVSDKVDQLNIVPLVHPHDIMTSGLSAGYPTSSASTKRKSISSFLQPYSQQNDDITKAHLFPFNGETTPLTAISNTTTKPMKRKSSESGGTPKSGKKIISFQDFKLRKTFPKLYETMQSTNKEDVTLVLKENTFHGNTKSEREEQESRSLVQDDVFQDKSRNNQVSNDINTATVHVNDIYTTTVPVNDINTATEPVNDIYTTTVPVNDIYTTTVPVNYINTATEPVNDINTATVPVNDINTATVPGNDINTTTVPVNDINTATEPVNDINTTTVPVNDINTTTVPVNDINKATVPVNDINTATVPGNDINTTTEPGNDINTTTEPGNDINTATLPGNDINTMTVPENGDLTGNDKEVKYVNEHTTDENTSDVLGNTGLARENIVIDEMEEDCETTVDPDNKPASNDDYNAIDRSQSKDILALQPVQKDAYEYNTKQYSSDDIIVHQSESNENIDDRIDEGSGNISEDSKTVPAMFKDEEIDELNDTTVQQYDIETMEQKNKESILEDQSEPGIYLKPLIGDSNALENDKMLTGYITLDENKDIEDTSENKTASKSESKVLSKINTDEHHLEETDQEMNTNCNTSEESTLDHQIDSSENISLEITAGQHFYKENTLNKSGPNYESEYEPEIVISDDTIAVKKSEEDSVIDVLYVTNGNVPEHIITDKIFRSNENFNKINEKKRRKLSPDEEELEVRESSICDIKKDVNDISKVEDFSFKVISDAEIEISKTLKDPIKEVYPDEDSGVEIADMKEDRQPIINRGTPTPSINNEDLITEDKDNTREEYNAKDANTSLEDDNFFVILEKVQDNADTGICVDKDQYKAGADEYVNEAVLETNRFAFRNNEYRINGDENTVENEIIADKNENESKENYVRNESVIDEDFEDQFNDNLENTASKDFIGKDSSHENADRTKDFGNDTVDYINKALTNISSTDKSVLGYSYEEMKNRSNVVIRSQKGDIVKLKKKAINPRLNLLIENLTTQVKSPKEVKHKNIKTKSKQIPKKKQETIKRKNTIKKENTIKNNKVEKLNKSDDEEIGIDDLLDSSDEQIDTSNSKIVSVKHNKKPVKQVQHKKEEKDEKVSPPKLFKKRVKEVFIVSKKFLQKEDKKCTPDIEVIEGNASGSSSPVRPRRAAAATGGARRRQLMSPSPDAISYILSSNCRSSKLFSVHPEDQPLFPQLRRLLTCDAYHCDDQQVADEFPGLYSLPWFKPLILSFLILEHQPLLLLSKILKTYMNKLLGALEVSNLTSLAMCKDRLYSSRGKTWTMRQWVQQVVNRIPELQDCIELDMAYVCIILVFHCFIVMEDRQVINLE